MAIMKKSWKLLPKILTGEKTIESRWYKTKCEAWGKVKAEDTIYFKDSGEPVSLKANVAKALEFSDLTPPKVKEILEKYGGRIGLDFFTSQTFKNVGASWNRHKKYCVLIFLKNVRKVKPFNISKTGFGAPCAWLTIKNINQIKTTDCL